MVKYYKVELPTNVFYYSVNDEDTISEMDIIKNKPKDASGNIIRPLDEVYTMGVLQTDAKATITAIDTLPEGMTLSL